MDTFANVFKRDVIARVKSVCVNTFDNLDRHLADYAGIFINSSISYITSLTIELAS